MAAASMLGNEIAELATGEGKTFVGAITSFARGLQGQGVHFMTTNAYLAKRDWQIVCETLKPLPIKIGWVDREMSPQEKVDAYKCDVTYGPGYEFGFDYLRDQMAILDHESRSGLGKSIRRSYRDQGQQKAIKMQRNHFCAIVDEADSVMIDDATTPLVLSQSMDRPHPHPEPYLCANELVHELALEEHYTMSSQTRQIQLTNKGVEYVEAAIDSSIRENLRELGSSMCIRR